MALDRKTADGYLDKFHKGRYKQNPVKENVPSKWDRIRKQLLTIGLVLMLVPIIIVALMIATAPEAKQQKALNLLQCAADNFFEPEICTTGQEATNE